MSCVTSLAYSLLLTVELVYLISVVGFNPLQLVLIGTVRQGICFLLQIPTGILADMYSRRWAVVIGLLLLGSGYLLEGSFPVPALVFVVQPLWGLGVTLMDGADAAWIADEVGVEQAGSLYLRAAQVGSLTSLLGIALSAVLVNVYLPLPLILGGSLFIVLGLLLAVVMPERHFTPAPRETRSTFQQMGHTVRIGVRLVRLRPVLLTILGIAVFTGAFSAGFDQLWNYYLLHRFTFPALGSLISVTWFCIIEAGIVLTNFCGLSVVRRYVDTNDHRSVVIALIVVNSLMVVCVIGFALAGQFALALTAFFLFTMAAGPSRSLGQVWMNQNLDSSVRATLFSLQGQVSAIAQMAGGPLLGIVATRMGAQTALIVAGIILSPPLLFYARSLYYHRPITDLKQPEETGSLPVR
jgi:DHA3 family tetracycline resistance protein-like MFS transporter